MVSVTTAPAHTAPRAFSFSTMSLDDLLNASKLIYNPPPLVVVLVFIVLNALSNRRGSLMSAIRRIEENGLKYTAGLHFSWAIRDECVWECDANGNWRWASPALAAMLGLDPQDMHGRGWLEAIETQEERTAVARAWIDAMTNNVPWSATFTVHNRKTGERFKVESRCWPCIDPTGKQFWHYGSFTRKTS